MLTVQLPDPSTYAYARSKFPDMGNLLRQTEFNRRDFREYVDRNVFNLENQHILVGLLQMLSIDPEWSLEEVVGNTRFRANSLCTTFKITSINHIGAALTNGFYRENVREHWGLLDNTKVYDEAAISLDTMRAVVPLYSTVLKRGYKHSILHSSLTTDNKGVTDIALIGLDLVELAVGWWLYMKENREVNTGISAYVCQYPLVQAQFIHNQLTVTNILYEFFVKERPLEELLQTDTVSFTTVGEEKLLKKYLLFIINWMTGRRMTDLGHMISMIGSVYQVPYFNYVPAGKNALFHQTSWFHEPQVLKLYAIYLSVANRLKYKASDINVEVDRVSRAIISNFSRIPETYCREAIIALADEVVLLNNQNYK